MATESDSGRVNQKRRTHVAIVDACRTMIRGGGPVTMPEVARAALVSEATAYRYFPDLISLLNEAFVGMWPSPADALKPVARSHRIAQFAGGFGDFLNLLGRQQIALSADEFAHLPAHIEGLPDFLREKPAKNQRSHSGL